MIAAGQRKDLIWKGKTFVKDKTKEIRQVTEPAGRHTTTVFGPVYKNVAPGMMFKFTV